MANGWGLSCVTYWTYSDGSVLMECTIYETWTPPPIDWSAGTYTIDLSYCSMNPTACTEGNWGGGGNGGGDGGATATNPDGTVSYDEGEDPCIDNTGLTEIDGSPFLDLADEASLDCRKVKCPSPQELQNSAYLQDIATKLMEKTLATGLEYGVWVYRKADGSFWATPPCEGYADFIPCLTTPPDEYVVASIHTHPPRPGAFEGASSPDQWNSKCNNIYVVVRTASHLYIAFWDPEGQGKLKPSESGKCMALQ